MCLKKFILSISLIWTSKRKVWPFKICWLESFF